MAEDWAAQQAERMAGPARSRAGVWLFLGGTDAGKTTLVTALARRLTGEHEVAVLDADIGQSHIGPPTTVGWALAQRDTTNLAVLRPERIAFVGDVTPLGSLLQLTAAMLNCLRSAATVADVVLVDTPGLVMSPAAQALWWTMQSVAKPGRIVVIQRERECGAVLSGLNQDVSHIVTLAAPAGNVQRSPAQRQNHRKQVFARYFRQTCVYNVPLNGVAVRTARGVTGQGAVGHLVGLGDDDGVDRAIGVIEGWQPAQNAANQRGQAPFRDLTRQRAHWGKSHPTRCLIRRGRKGA